MPDIFIYQTKAVASKMTEQERIAIEVQVADALAEGLHLPESAVEHFGIRWIVPSSSKNVADLHADIVYCSTDTFHPTNEERVNAAKKVARALKLAKIERWVNILNTSARIMAHPLAFFCDA